MIASLQGPGLMPPLDPFGQSDLNRPPRIRDLARHYSFSIARQTFGSIGAEHIC